MATFDVVASDLGFPEGPVWQDDGRLLVTSTQRGRVYALREGRVEQEWDLGGGGGNGLAVDREGTIYVSQNGGVFHDEAPRVPSGIQRIRGDEVDYVLAGLDATNDVCIGPDGKLYITDPRGRPNRANLAAMRPGRIFQYDLPARTLRLLAQGPRFTNALTFDAAGKNIYVAETFGQRVLRYGWSAETGDLTGPTIFCDIAGGGNPDGIVFDAEGNLWVTVTGPGKVHRYAPDGRLIQALDCGEGSIPTHCCFGGRDGRTLFVTCGGTGQVIAFQTDTQGAPFFK